MGKIAQINIKPKRKIPILGYGISYKKLSALESARRKKYGRYYLSTFPTEGVSGYKLQFSKRHTYQPGAFGIVLADSRSQELANLALGFSRGTLKIYEIQGLEFKDKLVLFSKNAKTTWANYLVGTAIEHARRMKLGYVKLLRPEANPAVLWKLLSPERRNAIRALYYGIAKRFGFKKIKGKKFLIKKLE